MTVKSLKCPSVSVGKRAANLWKRKPAKEIRLRLERLCDDTKIPGRGNG